MLVGRREAGPALLGDPVSLGFVIRAIVEQLGGSVLVNLIAWGSHFSLLMRCRSLLQTPEAPQKNSPNGRRPRPAPDLEPEWAKKNAGLWPVGPLKEADCAVLCNYVHVQNFPH